MDSNILRLIFILTISFLEQYNALKILLFIPSPSKSHAFIGQAMLRSLAQHGHEVTMVSQYPLTKPIPNYRDIILQDLLPVVLEMNRQRGGKTIFEVQTNNPLNAVFQVYEFGYLLTKQAIADPAVQQLLKSNETFDIVVGEIFMHDVFFAFAEHFNAQAVGLSTLGASVWCNDHVGNPQPYAYVPELWVAFTDHMTFFERLINTITAVTNELFYNFIHLPRMEELRKIHLPHTKRLPEILNNVSLVLLNSHPSLSNPRPLVPNMIEIGGFHVDPPKPIPEDLQKILDTEKNGIIYFSLGSTLQGSQLPSEVRNAFLKVFSRLKQTVLWKWESKLMPDQPKNVIIRPWFPQQDLLAHPNVKLFITQGGLLSTIEAVSRGVPLIGIPVMADQKLNIAKAKALGYAQWIDYRNVTEESLTWALNEVLNNPRYSETAKYRSSVLNDRAISPSEELNYWIEYVVRHKGAKHLRTARNDLKLYQYLLLDIVGFLAVVLAAIFIISLWSIRIIWKKLFFKFTPNKVGIKKKVN